MKLNFRERKGITLIALVITIVILLILAGITINSLSDNGLFGKTKEAKKEAEYAQAQEEINMKILEAQMNKNGEATLEDLVKVLKEDSTYTYTYTIKFNPTALLTQNGDIKGTETDEELKTKLSTINEIYVIHKGYEFKIKSKLELETINNGKVENPEQSKERYKVIYDANGGELEGENEVQIEYGNTYGELPQPTRANCTFEGWYTNKKIAEGTKIEADDEFNLEENQTLYAIWSHTHNTANGATLVSGIALANDSIYSTSGGCYTEANSYSHICGSTSFTVLSASGYTSTASQYCATCGSGKLGAGGTFTMKCNNCGKIVSTGISGHIYCVNTFNHIGSINGNQGYHSGLYMGSLTSTSCKNNINGTNYSRSCGLSSGILDQE